MLGFLLEQLPHPDNRVTIRPGGHVDALRLPRPVIRYDIDAWTRQGAAVARECAVQWFEELGAEDLTTYDGPGRPMAAHQRFTWNDRPYSTMGAGHLCGTHRMGKDRADHVVDPDQRSWDHRNLFVVGAGSMPTIGTSNPTLTLAALACRTAAAMLEELA
jgi:glucose dehydrogenase